MKGLSSISLEVFRRRGDHNGSTKMIKRTSSYTYLKSRVTLWSNKRMEKFRGKISFFMSFIQSFKNKYGNYWLVGLGAGPFGETQTILHSNYFLLQSTKILSTIWFFSLRALAFEGFGRQRILRRVWLIWMCGILIICLSQHNKLIHSNNYKSKYIGRDANPIIFSGIPNIHIKINIRSHIDEKKFHLLSFLPPA